MDTTSGDVGSVGVGAVEGTPLGRRENPERTSRPARSARAPHSMRPSAGGVGGATVGADGWAVFTDAAARGRTTKRRPANRVQDRCCNGMCNLIFVI